MAGSMAAKLGSESTRPFYWVLVMLLMALSLKLVYEDPIF